MTLPLIKVVQLTLTNRCQCNCKHCGVSKLRQVIKGELTIQQIDLLFQDFKLAGCLVVDLFGGEPTLRQDLFDIIKRGKSYGFELSLETNGYVIDQAYMQGLAAAGLDQIYLSLDDYRAEIHDAIRGRKGSFNRAVRALELGARSGIIMHVSIVPQSPNFFSNGDINRFMQFVLAHGAERVRLLLPRFVGDSIREGSGPMCAGEEKELFSHVSPRYFNYIYLHTPGTPLNEKNVCTAKQVFCHVMSNGWVAPCPYFPLVFGDAKRESIIDIFERIQGHPLVRLGGEYCPMRNEEYINNHMRKLGLDRPFFPISVENQVDIGAPCSAGCIDCAYGGCSSPRSADDIIREMREVPADYTRIEFYGGDAFQRDDLFAILDCVPQPKKITLWSTCSPEKRNAAFGDRLRSYPIEAIKVHFAEPLLAGLDRFDFEGGLEEALRRVRSMAAWGLPVHLYVPDDFMERISREAPINIRDLGVERLYTFSKDSNLPLVNSAACFGRRLGRSRLLWVQKQTPNQSERVQMTSANDKTEGRGEEFDYLCVDLFMKTLVDAQALSSAFELGLIDYALQHPRVSIDDLRKDLGSEMLGLRFLLDLLSANHVIEKNDGEMQLTQLFLQALKFRDLLEAKLKFAKFVAADMIDHLTTLIHRPHQFRQNSQTFSLFCYGRSLEQSLENFELTKRWVRITSALTKYEAQVGLKHYDFSRHRRMLDIGGNSGEFALQICKRHPGIRATVFDLPVVCDVGTEHIQFEPQTERITFIKGNAMADPLPEGFDLITFKSMLHDWPEREAKHLIARAERVLAPGGTLLIFERGPIEVAGKTPPYSLIPILLFFRSYRSPQIYKDQLAASGFRDIAVRRIDLEMPFFLITGMKTA